MNIKYMSTLAGKEYGLLCKPKDDLRKDCRFMEFNMMVNRYISVFDISLF